jgi:catechol 2,3-dioxygenase-like lactoylglutathione lyase family enzyme
MNLNQVTLPSNDIEASVRFYRGMGFRLIVDSPDYARFECPHGDATFSVHLVDTVPADSGLIVYFESDELDEWTASLKQQGYRFDSDPVDQRWGWREAHLKDPAGNVICLFFAGSMRKDPPWRVAAP